MNKVELNVIELLEYLQDMVESSPKMPITGKTIIDKKEFNEVIDQIINYLPDQFKKAQWVINEKDRILQDAQKEYDSVKKETFEIMKQNVENHDIVREAKLRANEIIALAQRDAKAIRIGSREYSNEILMQLDVEIEKQKADLIKSMQESFEKVAKEIDDNLTKTGTIIKENIAELRCNFFDIAIIKVHISNSNIPNKIATEIVLLYSIIFEVFAVYFKVNKLLTKKVIKKLIIPWINFNKLYLAKDTSYFDTNELIWAITDNPEKEQIKLIIANFNGSVKGNVVISLQPLVNSTLPKKNP